MYESAFLEHRLDKASYKAEEPKLRAELLEAQLDLVEGRKFSVLILVTGMDGAGKGELIQRLSEWLDPRHLRTNGYEEPDEGLESDTEKDMIAYDAGISGAGASAEEAAVHLTDEP